MRVSKASGCKLEAWGIETNKNVSVKNKAWASKAIEKSDREAYARGSEALKNASVKHIAKSSEATE